MNAAALLADEGSFKMNPEDFSAGFLRFALLRDVRRDSLDGTKGLVDAGGDRGGHQGGGAELRDFAGDRSQCFRAALHDVAAAGAVNVNINETGDGGLFGSADFLRSRGQAHPRAGPDRFDHALANHDPSIVDFSYRRERAAGVDQ